MFIFFFFNDTATTEIYTLSLHDALPISIQERKLEKLKGSRSDGDTFQFIALEWRSEGHTSELQSPDHLVCRLLLEKKKKKNYELQPMSKMLVDGGYELSCGLGSFECIHL